MRRKVCYVSGSRADFGLMVSTLQRVQADPVLDLSVCVTGMHLSKRFGNTVEEINDSGLRISGRIEVDLAPGTGAGMALALADELRGMVGLFEKERPDIVLLLGDRGEMMAGALAAIHLNIPVAHIHGGERSGTVDEPVRHAISKLSHYHFVATAGSRERLLRMGEFPGSVHVTGAPGLDGVSEAACIPREKLCRDLALDPSCPVALVVFHPVLQSADEAGEQISMILAEVAEAGIQAVCLEPNADAGHIAIQAELARRATHANVSLRLVTHFKREVFLSWLAAVDLLVGNSSSGIIEAASFGTPVVNIGDRQNGRERNSNVRDVPLRRDAIQAALQASLKCGRCDGTNLYGDGHSGERMVALLRTLPLNRELLNKTIGY